PERKYCKAYLLRDLRRFPNWFESKINWKAKKDANEVLESADFTFSDDDIMFVHQNFIVTQSMWENENVVFNQLTPEWMEFCSSKLDFKVPDDLDLIVNNPPDQSKTSIEHQAVEPIVNIGA